MFTIKLKALLARGSDDGFYAPGAKLNHPDLHRERVDATAKASHADPAPRREEPKLLPGFGTSASWGVW